MANTYFGFISNLLQTMRTLVIVRITSKVINPLGLSQHGFIQKGSFSALAIIEIL